ncbi:MAG: carbohydrate kinase family protein [Clostridiales bacterium]|jgi:hypothetical protein|nr:carbohydrate kinase family protein [Clostridiales bacterium]
MQDVFVLETREKLLRESGSKKKMFVGLDGFVDEVIHIVDTRQDFERYTRVDTIAEFGRRVSEAAGFSANFEFVPKQFKLGGNGPIYANAMIESGMADLTYAGSVGEKSVHPVFANMEEKGTVYPVCDPGHTDALEFNDGKLMLGKHATLKNVTWENVLKAVGGFDKFVSLIKESALFGMENWTMLPYMSDIWRHVADEVLPLLPDSAEPPIAFFDLADPAKRTKQDIADAMGLISRFEGKFRAVLGLNRKEADEVARALDIEIKGSDNEASLESLARAIYERLGIYCLVVHPTKEAVVISGEGFFRVAGPFCEKPALTTGAGDNFNAGFCIGLSIGLSPREALVLGVGTSGFYVRNAKSPSSAELAGFLEKWANGVL